MTAKHYFTGLLATGALIATVLIAFWTQPAHSETAVLFQAEAPLEFGHTGEIDRVTFEDICGGVTE